MNNKTCKQKWNTKHAKQIENDAPPACVDKTIAANQRHEWNQNDKFIFSKIVIVDFFYCNCFF